MEDLGYLRNQINEIDEQLVDLFLRRMEIVHSVAEYKKQNSLNVKDRSREEEILNKYLQRADDEARKQQIKEFIENLMYISRKAQREIMQNEVFEASGESICKGSKAGFLGVLGSFSHQALVEYSGGSAEAVSCKNFKEIFEALDRGEIEYGILPIENSSTGSITEVYDLLGNYNFFINGEKCLGIEQNLLGISGTEMSDIKEVYSHTQGFLQCSKFLNKHNKWKLMPYLNTAGSAEFIKRENNNSKVCIAGRNAAKLYGLSILKENINNSSSNMTRFILINRKMSFSHECDKVSIVISLPHKVGALYKILKHFEDNNCNLVKIESRPIIDESWHYFFYIDFNGNLSDKNTIDALRCIENESLYYKLLGNFKSEAKF